MADKAYSSRAIRQYLQDRGIRCVIRTGQSANRRRKRKASGRPVTYDWEVCKRYNVVECSFKTLKQRRALATRYDKLALTYRSAVVLQAMLIWKAAIVESRLGDTPRSTGSLHYPDNH